MSKTAPIPDDVHALIIDKQIELKRKHKITVKISDIIAMCIKDSIKRTEKLLGLKSDEISDVVSDKDQNNANGQEVKITNDGHVSNVIGEDASSVINQK